MNRVAVFVDGFNLYHALNENPAYHKYKWLNLEKFSRCFLTQNDTLVEIFYFTSYVTWDTALIVSGDSDLIPAIEAVKKTFPTKQVGIAIPVGRRAEELKKVTDFHKKVKQIHLQTCQFDDIVTVDENTQLKRPDSWTQSGL